MDKDIMQINKSYLIKGIHFKIVYNNTFKTRIFYKYAHI